MIVFFFILHSASSVGVTYHLRYYCRHRCCRFTSPPERVPNIAISVSFYLSMCLFVCLSLCWHISKTTRTNFTKSAVHDTCGRGSVLLWRQCSAFKCTFGIMIMELMGQYQRRRVCFVQFVRWRHRERSLLFSTTSCFLVAVAVVVMGCEL